MTGLPLSRRARYLVWVWALGLLCACGGGGSDSPEADSSYLPNTDGFTWTYRVTRSGAAPGNAVATIDGTQQIGGVLAQRLRLTTDFGSGEVLGEIRTDVLRIHSSSFFGRTVLYTPPMDLVEFPFGVGDSFQEQRQIQLGIFTIELTADTRVSSFGNVTAGGRTYEDAFRLDSTINLRSGPINIRPTLQVWLAPRTGAVKGVIHIPDNPFFPISGDIQAELTSAVP